ncbi:porin family protein [Leptolyngbya sp. KIOST-1]|uniref:porin family protein n=1 Tax=Leptolyngbya sp. KIOST-1 TaxID=1229172 RepID=UPI000AD53F75|nr:porin family protein [Leptolyngbya sp. KIOST-1]
MKTRSIAAIALGLTAASMVALPMAANAQQAPTDYNYVGAGVGIGNVGTSDVGLSVNSKFTVADNISLRPGVITDLNFSGNGETSFLLPVTYDFNPVTNNGRLLPYVGAGLSVATEGSTTVGPLVTGGVDYRITDRIVANGGVNWSLHGNSRVNGTIGLGYTF